MSLTITVESGTATSTLQLTTQQSNELLTLYLKEVGADLPGNWQSLSPEEKQAMLDQFIEQAFYRITLTAYNQAVKTGRRDGEKVARDNFVSILGEHLVPPSKGIR